MATPEETFYVEQRSVACDGGPLGHPKVYLNMGDDDEIVCPYCSRHFILKDDAKEPAGGH